MNNEITGFLSTFIFSFVLLIISAFSIALFARSIITKYRRRETEKMRSWVELAKLHNLEMVFDNGSQDGAYIEGYFRRRHLRLETFQRDTVSEVSKIYTRLTISINKDVEKKKEKTSSPETTTQEFITMISSSEINAKLKDQVELDEDDQVIRYEQVGVEENADYLSFLFSLMSDTAEYLKIVKLDGEAIFPLQSIMEDRNNKFQDIGRHLLQNISKDTTDKLAYQAEKLLCEKCLSRCVAHQIKLSNFETIICYGCRTCQQSQDFIEWEGIIIACLDRNMTTEQVQQNGSLRVSWLIRDGLFDFDKVEIDAVTDEDVERFAIQVGNDTSPARKLSYKEIPCRITPQSILSENTIKILKYTFGRVEKE